MNKGRRDTTQAIVWAGVSALIPMTGQQDLIAEVQRVLHYPASGPGDKDLKYLEQKIRYYWLDRYNAIIVPADLVSHVVAYVREVTTLLDRSLLPAIRTRLCACLSQGMLLIGVNFYDVGQFQTARACFQAALESAQEAKHNILQALAWNWDSFSWVHSDETDRYEHALGGMLKACYFASLESDGAVQCNMQADLAEVYAYLNEKDACLEALELANRVNGNALGDWHHIHHFGISSANGFRGRCLPQLYQSGVPETYPLLEDARQALETALSQPNVAPLKRAFNVVDMALLYALKGDVEAACNYAKQTIGMADTSAPLRQRLVTIHTHLRSCADVQAVKDLDAEMRALALV